MYIEDEYSATLKIEYGLGPCSDEADARDKALKLIEHLKKTDVDVINATLLEVQEW